MAIFCGHFGPLKADEPKTSLQKRIWITVTLTIFSSTLTLLFLGMRVVLSMGGMVATGGPYVIAHPAPDWIWIMPLSALLMIAALITGVLMSFSGIYGPNLMQFSWSALFIALGWNFLDFGMGLSRGTGLVWPWLICALLFIPMGLLPMILIVKRRWDQYKDRKLNFDTAWLYTLLAQLVLVVISVSLAAYLFRIVTETT